MSYCGWASGDALDREYHDTEWGVPLHDDRKQFEFLMMEVMQCGLSWGLVMRKRDVLRRCFHGFDYDAVAQFTAEDVERILDTEGMIRSRSKVEAVIGNARCFQEIRREYGSFSAYLWGWTGGRTIIYEGHAQGHIPASNALSERISRDLKKRGFRYVGPVTIYSHLQACGIINDHDADCPCRAPLLAGSDPVILPPDGEKNVRDYSLKRD